MPARFATSCPIFSKVVFSYVFVLCVSLKLLSAGSGEAALVYLYMKSTGDVTLKQAEQQLNMPMQNLGWAESLLKRLGLMDAVVPKARFDRQQAPVYTGEEVTAFSARDPGFQLLQGEVSRRMGRVNARDSVSGMGGISFIS